MKFSTSHLVGIFAVVLTVLSISPSITPVVAKPLQITGPEGEVNSVERQYGPTTSADTFWSIAQAVKPDDSVTVYQVMSALFDANPHAFSGQNYNSLEQGMVLVIPNKAIIAKISKVEAKKRAENNDRGWSAPTQSRPEKVAPKAKPVTKTPVVKSPTNVTPAPVKPATPSVKPDSAEIKRLNKKLEQVQALNLTLTDELARAMDENVLNAVDAEALEQQNLALKEENALLRQALQDKSSQIEALETEVTAEQAKIDTLTNEPEPTTTLWRTLMDNPLWLVLGAVVPALLGLALIWLLFIRRKDTDKPVSDSLESSHVESNNDASYVAADDHSDNISTATDSDHTVDLAVEMADDPAALLNSIDTPQPEQVADVVIENAVGEPVENAAEAPIEDTSEDVAEEGQSLDDLWAEAMGEQGDDAESDPFAATQTTPEDDLESLLTDFDQNPIVEPQVSGDELPDSDTNTNADLDLDLDADDLDALLAGFEEKAVSESQPANTSSEPSPVKAAAEVTDPEMDDIESLLAANTPMADDNTGSNDELESLMAEFDIPVDEITSQAQASDIDALSDEVAADLEQSLEIAAELELGADDVNLDDGELDHELDALLADFETPAADSVAKTDDSIDLSDTSHDKPADKPIDDDMLDSLFAEFDLSESSADERVETLNKGDVETDAALNASTELNPLDDKSADPSAIDWDAVADELSDKPLSDDELLSALAATGETTTNTDATAFTLEEESKLTVDQALAALDADESSELPADIVDEVLGSFEKDNDFIDIDRLLNEANEDDSETDLYQELDVDMGELDSLMGNTPMVDVDDAENAINAKLDLARAYIEIDDNDSAKALLKEVKLDGNDRQQQEAVGLIKELP
ncbi:FimV/HubP family polar landmark protein [Shewanella youngdeokensis]|uniref:FimV/HubP family polar landmark protein n=1 Tax=Shewanella youngdeokensis TaxID=2999068 RepID=A0ABZ0JW56_9GAMM|nr:FimV/HubP family polar landmark protein [Shewanella sp. DAU334]